jgi:hypothetical protein
VPEECLGSRQLAAPARPNIANTFEARVDVEAHEGSGPAVFGEGFYAAIEAENKAVERYDLHPRQYHVRHELFLQRYDLQEEYFLSSEDAKDCHERKVAGPLPPAWSWVANASYAGEVKHHEVVLDAWEARFGGERVAVAVTKEDPNTPVFFERESVHSKVINHFVYFNVTTPRSSFFNVPQGE